MATSPLLQMQPITLTPETYKDPRASILYGTGNKAISDADIKNFISGAKSNDDIMKAALQYNVSADQIAKAMGGKSGFDTQSITGYLDKQGISREKTPAQTLNLAQMLPPELLKPPAPVVAPTVTPTPVKLNEQTDTVQGRLNSLLSNPNSPLMQRAETMAAQSANKRGLLNSSIGVSAGQAALTDAALQIATPDAQARVNAAMQNSQQANQVGLQNAQNKLTAGMFNNDMYAKLGMFNNEMQFKAGAFNAEQVNAIMGKHLDNNNRIQLAEIEAKYQRDLQGSASSAKLFSDVMQLVTQVSTSDLPPEAKQGNIDNLFKMLDMGLSLNNSFAGLGLDRMFSAGGNNTQSGSILNQLSGGQINPGQTSNTTNQITAPSFSKASTITGQPLGQSPTNPRVFNTVSGQISTNAAQKLKEIFTDLDPRFVIPMDHYNVMGLKQTPASVMNDNPTANPYMFDPFSKVDMRAIDTKLKQGLKDGTIVMIPVRDPKYDVLLDKALAEFMNGDLIYDPNNILGLAG